MWNAIVVGCILCAIALALRVRLQDETGARVGLTENLTARLQGRRVSISPATLKFYRAALALAAMGWVAQCSRDSL